MNGLARGGRPYARITSALFAYVCALCALASIAILAILLWQMVRFAWGWLDWQFLTSYDSQLSAAKAGVLAALVGSLYRT
jgi:phosphate transport system permease protein